MLIVIMRTNSSDSFKAYAADPRSIGLDNREESDPSRG
jgi:hypothetical protein